MEKLYYTIGEVAELLGENVSLIRFWSNSFEKYVKPVRTAKGNRQFTSSDVNILKQIHYLVKEKGLTLEGAAKQLRSDRSGFKDEMKALESLKQIRKRLVEIKKSL